MSEQEPILCYVSGQWAYFTTRPLNKQWGDDWDDAPYEHNAGRPYTDLKEPPRWTITQVAFEGPFDEPCANVCNSPYSVEVINRDVVPWLSTATWYSGAHVEIPAGTPLSKFVELVKQGGGKVFLEAR